LAGQEKEDDNIPTRLFLSRSEMCCQRPWRNEAQIDTTVAATGATAAAASDKLECESRASAEDGRSRQKWAADGRPSIKSYT
jgi:hypothetical protein